MKLKSCMLCFLLCVMCLGSSGCSTYRTLETATPGSPILFSGTRMNINAIRHDHVALKKFNTSPPKYPWLDLPASLLMDVIMLTVTGGPAACHALFDSPRQ